MADRELTVILASGEITSINKGGTASGDAVLKKSENDALYKPFDNTGTSLSATTIQDAIAELANVGLAHMILATPYTGGQTLSTTPVKLSMFDTISHNINGALTPVADTSEAVPAHSFTVDKAGLFSVYGTVSAEFASADTVSIILYKNGSPLTPPASVQGRGAGKPVLFAYTGMFDFLATDVLEMYAYSDSASTSTLVTGSSVIVERKPLA